MLATVIAAFGCTLAAYVVGAFYNIGYKLQSGTVIGLQDGALVATFMHTRRGPVDQAGAIVERAVPGWSARVLVPGVVKGNSFTMIVMPMWIPAFLTAGLVTCIWVGSKSSEAGGTRSAK